MALHVGKKFETAYPTKVLQKTGVIWDYSGSPVVKTLHFHCRGYGFSHDS